MRSKELSNNSLWDLIAQYLTELSHRDGVDYRIKATEESVERKIQCFIDESEADCQTWEVIDGES